MPKMNAETLTKNLQHFCGTEQYYPHWLGIRYTDGVKYLADNAEAYWLIDAIASHQPKALRNQRLREFQVWFLHVGDTHEFIPLLSFSAKNNQERLEHKTFTKNPDFSHSVRK